MATTTRRPAYTGRGTTGSFLVAQYQQTGSPGAASISLARGVARAAAAASGGSGGWSASSPLPPAQAPAAVGAAGPVALRKFDGAVGTLPHDQKSHLPPSLTRGAGGAARPRSAASGRGTRVSVTGLRRTWNGAATGQSTSVGMPGQLGISGCSAAAALATPAPQAGGDGHDSAGQPQPPQLMPQPLAAAPLATLPPGSGAPAAAADKGCIIASLRRAGGEVAAPAAAGAAPPLRPPSSTRMQAAPRPNRCWASSPPCGDQLITVTGHASLDCSSTLVQAAVSSSAPGNTWPTRPFSALGHHRSVKSAGPGETIDQNSDRPQAPPALHLETRGITPATPFNGDRPPPGRQFSAGASVRGGGGGGGQTLAGTPESSALTAAGGGSSAARGLASVAREESHGQDVDAAEPGDGDPSEAAVPFATALVDANPAGGSAYEAAPERQAEASGSSTPKAQEILQKQASATDTQSGGSLTPPVASSVSPHPPVRDGLARSSSRQQRAIDVANTASAAATSSSSLLPPPSAPPARPWLGEAGFSALVAVDPVAAGAALAVDDLQFEDGAILGAEDLPVVGAAGVLVLPRRKVDSRGPSEEDDRIFAALDDPFSFVGWGFECELQDASPDRIFEQARVEKRFAEYLSAEAAGSTAAADTGMQRQELQSLPMEVMQELAADLGQHRPAQGPSILQLARDPKRREECPACANEWLRMAEQVQSMGVVETSAAIPRRRATAAKSKMHSVRCNWMWFQTSLTSMLSSLRFDEHGDARSHVPAPHSVFPPAMADVWQFWKGKATKTLGAPEPVVPAAKRSVSLAPPR